MKRLSIALFGLILALFPSNNAYASATFDFAFSGGGVLASGQFTATPSGVGTYLITGVSGTMSGEAITGVLPAKSFAGNDNTLQDPGPVLDSFGVGYVLANGDAINLYTYQGVDNVTLYDPSTGIFTTTAGTLVITSVTGGADTQFAMTLNPGAIQLQSKQSTTVRLTLSSLNGFGDVMSLGCLGLPIAATCTFSNSQVTLAANGTQTVQIVVDTGLGGLASVPRGVPSRSGTSSGVLLCFMPLGVVGGLLLFGARSGKGRGGLLLVLLLTGATLGLSGCGGVTVIGTPPGTYSFKVTASGAQTGVTESQTVVMTVAP